MSSRLTESVVEDAALDWLGGLLPKLLSGEIRLNYKARVDYIPENESGL